MEKITSTDSGKWINVRKYVENYKKHFDEVQTTSDFDFIADLIDRGVQAGYSEAIIPTTYQILGYKRNVKSFEPAKDYELNKIRTVERVAEKGQYLPKEPVESYYEYINYKYGEQYDVSWEAWLRDGKDLNILHNMFAKSAAWVQSAEYTKEELFTSAWAGNASFFTVQQGNLLTSQALTADNLAEAIATLKSFTDTLGNIAAYGGPMYLVVPPSLEYLAKNLIGSPMLITGANLTMGNLNTNMGTCKVIVNNFLPVYDTGDDANSWYVFASPAIRPAVRYGYVEGYEDIEITVRDSDARMLMSGAEQSPFEGSFLTDDIEFRMRFNFGADLMDWRGAVRCTPDS